MTLPILNCNFWSTYLNHHVGHIWDCVDKIWGELRVRFNALLRHEGLCTLDGCDEECEVDCKLAKQGKDNVRAENVWVWSLWWQGFKWSCMRNEEKECCSEEPTDSCLQREQVLSSIWSLRPNSDVCYLTTQFTSCKTSRWDSGCICFGYSKCSRHSTAILEDYDLAST